MAADNPVSFLHVVKPEIDLDPCTDVYADEVYETGAANLRRLIDDGLLIREESPAIYLYRQRMGRHIQTGIVAGASVDEYEAGLIKKHEHTRPVKEDDRTRHLDALNANTGPVFLTYLAKPEIDQLVARLTSVEPTYDYAAIGARLTRATVENRRPDVWRWAELLPVTELAPCRIARLLPIASASASVASATA